MNKKELVAALAEKSEVTKKDAEKILDAFVEVVGSELAKDIIKTFLTTDFSGEERHQRRIDLISDAEERFGK